MGRDRAAADRDLRVGDRGHDAPAAARIVKLLARPAADSRRRQGDARAAAARRRHRALLVWRGPSFTAIGDAFAPVEWQWVVVAIALNLALGGRARARLDDRDPLGDEAAASRAAARLLRVLRRAVRERRAAGADRRARARRRARRASCRERKGAWATLVGTVFAHRVFDLVPGRAPRALRRRDREDPDLGEREPASLFDLRRHRALRVRVHRARARPHERGSTVEARAACAAHRDGAAGARRHALAARRGRRDLLPDPRLGLPALRGLDGDARVRHPRAAAGCRRRARC